ncbi:peptidylprolyl isomerase [Pseudoruegeria sp. SHC-113]|uniref:peptidylprolyl isomerase n=1 Tax=Pseudoruegeria sp. SHC-113 TaxID=2855439 RepID=UPI0021BB020F|nr:peptidylprolyl isomerase [Pseudoruegeria sp. SHC-113]MCT8158950.1 peptidyl-prolyl cis-trans isomerase [Pseudoruegeria sp. SHC-113]
MLRSLLREPLLHFALIGVVLFAVFAMRNPEAGAQADARVIVIDDADVERLRQNFTSVWNRPPEPEVLEGLVENYIYEEVLVREALALGMDQGDAVIRQRLRQKMEFLASAAAEAVAPTEDEIAAFHAENAAAYTRPARIGFQQIFLGDNGVEADAVAMLKDLENGLDWQTLGAMSLLPPELSSAPRAAIESLFGPGFYSELDGAEPAQWFGPVRSGYGLHIARITEVIPAQTLPLEDVRSKVEADLKQARAAEMAEKQRAFLLGRYTVERAEAAQ